MNVLRYEIMNLNTKLDNYDYEKEYIDYYNLREAGYETQEDETDNESDYESDIRELNCSNNKIKKIPRKLQ